MSHSFSEKRKINPLKPKVKLPGGKEFSEIKNIVNHNHLHTICEQGNCPNIAECWGKGTATFMILGNICTRACRFCSVKTGKPYTPDHLEQFKIAESVLLMKLKHCVITSVDRDDLPDGGAQHWFDVISEVKKQNPFITIEVLIPDFKFNTDSLDKIISSNPDIISHNLETIERLTPMVRISAKYLTSLRVLEYIATQQKTSKSGIMLGLGETMDEIISTLIDLKNVNCKIVTIGQYLQPTHKQLPVTKFYSNSEFEEIKKIAISMGFKHVESGALVRSSYHAENHIH
jgi:lipoyl synthase